MSEPHCSPCRTVTGGPGMVGKISRHVEDLLYGRAKPYGEQALLLFAECARLLVVGDWVAPDPE